MAVSIEAYFLINLSMNTLIIFIIARSRGRVRLGYVTASAAFGAIYAVASRSGLFPQLMYMPCQVLLALSMTVVGVRVDSFKDLLTGAMLLLGATMFFGGANALVIRMLGGQGIWSLIMGAGSGAIVLMIVLGEHRKKLHCLQAQIFIRRKKHAVHLTALIDTGNRLREPISALPVLIVEARRLKKLLPIAFDPDMRKSRLPAGFRLVAYGALNGSGRMACFQPDELLVSYGDGWLRAPDVWVAVYPGKIPGSAYALAPAVIGSIEPAHPGHFKYPRIQHPKGGRSGWSIPHSR